VSGYLQTVVLPSCTVVQSPAPRLDVVTVVGGTEVILTVVVSVLIGEVETLIALPIADPVVGTLLHVNSEVVEVSDVITQSSDPVEPTIVALIGFEIVYELFAFPVSGYLHVVGVPDCTVVQDPAVKFADTIAVGATGLAVIVPAPIVRLVPVAFAETGTGVVDPVPDATIVQDLEVSVIVSNGVVQIPYADSNVIDPVLLAGKLPVQVTVYPIVPVAGVHDADVMSADVRAVGGIAVMLTDPVGLAPSEVVTGVFPKPAPVVGMFEQTKLEVAPDGTTKHVPVPVAPVT
jgi:hypothetical protein